jgi:hypothetical protein
MAESDMNKSSWQKPASLHTAAATKSIGALIGWKRRFEDPIPFTVLTGSSAS